jgi:hypothetical protein
MIPNSRKMNGTGRYREDDEGCPRRSAFVAHVAVRLGGSLHRPRSRLRPEPICSPPPIHQPTKSPQTRMDPGKPSRRSAMPYPPESRYVREVMDPVTSPSRLLPPSSQPHTPKRPLVAQPHPLICSQMATHLSIADASPKTPSPNSLSPIPLPHPATQIASPNTKTTVMRRNPAFYSYRSVTNRNSIPAFSCPPANLL